jgi:hypothetical protein
MRKYLYHLAQNVDRGRGRIFGRPVPAAGQFPQHRTSPASQRGGTSRQILPDSRACCASSRGGRWDLTNVRIIRTDAATFLANFIPDSSVDCFHIYFPDPWPKKTPSQKTPFLPSQSRTTSPLSEDRRQFKNSRRLSRIF